MLLRLVIVVGLIILFVVPIYHVLKRRTIRVKSELEDELDAESRLTEIKQKKKSLKADCKEEVRNAKKRQKKLNKIQKEI